MMMSTNGLNSVCKLILPLVIFAGLYSCKNSEAPLSEYPLELMSNPSFEFLGQPSLDGWSPDDISKVSFSTDVPDTAHNKFSLSVSGQTRVRSTPVLIKGDVKKIRFSSWVKMVRNSAVPDSCGVDITAVLDGVTIFLWFYYASDTLWHYHELAGNLSAQPDTGVHATVILSGPFLRSEHRALFDQCKIEVLE